MSIIIFDTETSGLPKQGDFSEIKMLELGYLRLDEELNILDENRYLIDVDIEVPEIITELTGITKEELTKNGKKIDKVLENFLVDIKESDILIAHNNRFDLGVLRQEYTNINSEYLFSKYIYKKINLDSIQIFKNYIKKSEIENFKLQTVYNYYNEENFKQTHRALDDCHMIRNCLVKIKETEDYNSYRFYLNKTFNFKRYPRSCLKDIYKRDKMFVKKFLKNLPIGRNIFKFL